MARGRMRRGPAQARKFPMLERAPPNRAFGNPGPLASRPDGALSTC
jgi:hypothetical protein